MSQFSADVNIFLKACLKIRELKTSLWDLHK